MQPSNTLLALLCAFTLISCNQNTPDDTKKGGDTPTSQHQPSDPASWSPVGKRYVCDNDTINEDGYRYSIIDFVSKDSALSFFSASYDLTPISYIGEYYQHWAYSCTYPELKLLRGNNNVPLTFSDTLTLKYVYSKGTFYLR